MALQVTVYTVEARNRQDTPYPASEFYSYDYEDAQGYAQKNRLLLIENTYEWADSNLLEDYAPKDWAVVEENGSECDRFATEAEALEALPGYVTPEYPGPYTVQNIPDEG